MGVWIETFCLSVYLPSAIVTPFVGVWIETQMHLNYAQAKNVTPFVGVWIETQRPLENAARSEMSHPSWVCGLKLNYQDGDGRKLGHTLRGCVD